MLSEKKRCKGNCFFLNSQLFAARFFEGLPRSLCCRGIGETGVAIFAPRAASFSLCGGRFTGGFCAASDTKTDKTECGTLFVENFLKLKLQL